jgi:AraC-like DNA-binding protein
VERAQNSGVVEQTASTLAGWQAVVSSTMLPLHMVPVAGDRAFRARLRSRYFGPVGLMLIEGGPHSLVRIEGAEIRGEHYVNLSLQLSGRAELEQHGRHAALAPGDFVLFQTSDRYRRDFATDYRTVVLMLPQTQLGLPARSVRALTARRISARDGLGGVLSQFLTGIAGTFDDLSERAEARIAQSITDLVTATLVQTLDIDVSAHTLRSSRLTASIRAYIDVHHADPSCTPQSIADAHFVSLRHLHTVFRHEDTTLARVLRERRIQSVLRALKDPLRDWMSIASIANASGFGHASSFARTFRRAIGQNPQDYRARR